ncbi:hypothetical protein QJS04_geneDACA022787 [Acorus gramineus]|uniref:Uncharacterized protein n=1 Tax=Acorus gramineus TaxID=55184 RepID=A0AAV9B8Y3_ACOGR|nr:hypothetical protein QJS04_geneDACA022787 [Acorus gramineus]
MTNRGDGSINRDSARRSSESKAENDLSNGSRDVVAKDVRVSETRGAPGLVGDSLPSHQPSEVRQEPARLDLGKRGLQLVRGAIDPPTALSKEDHLPKREDVFVAAKESCPASCKRGRRTG